MKRQLLSRVLPASIAVGLAGLGVVSLSGHTPTPTDASPVLQSPDAMAPGTSALRAYLDPETGGITVGHVTSSETLDPDTQNALRRDSEGLVAVHHPDGSVSIDLQGRFQSVSMVHRDANGTTITCVDDNGKAQQVIDGDVVAPNVPEVK